MAVTSFFLGRPGSGKTTAYRHLCELLDSRGWQVTRIREYNILQRMFHNDFEHKRFRPVAHGGFDVLDFSVLDDALRELEQQVSEYARFAPRNEFIVVEFARDNYQTALQPLSSTFLNKTHLLYIDADLETCIQRIRQRVKQNRPNDNHYVSEHILRSYYSYDNRAYMQQEAARSAMMRRINDELASIQLPTQVIQFVDNNGPLTNIQSGMEQFVENILQQEQYQPITHEELHVKDEAGIYSVLS